MTGQEAIGAVIDEMYAMISGPAGPRHSRRQANCFLPEARLIERHLLGRRASGNGGVS